MSILSKLLGKAATKAATKVASKTASAQADDMLRASTKVAKSQADDIAKATTKTAKKATRPSYAQRLASKQGNDYMNSFGSVGGQTRKSFYDTYIGDGPMWKWGIDNGITPANVQDKVEGGLKSLGGIQSGLFDYADNAGIKVDLSDLFDNNKLNALTGTQRKRLADIGLDIDSIIGGDKATVSTGKANELYRALRDVGYKMADSADGTQKIWGKNLIDASRAISGRIDDTLAPIAGSYGLKQKTVEAMTDLGLNPKRIRAISEMMDEQVTPSLLRGEMSPMMRFEKLIGNKLPAEKTLNIAGIDTGLPNYISKATQAIGDIPLKVAAAAEQHPAAAMTAAAGGAGLLGSLLLGGGGGGNTNVNIGQGLGDSLTSGGTGVGLGTNGGDYGTASLGSLGTQGAENGTSASTFGSTTGEPTINGWSYDDLEQGYMNAMLAGDSSAAAAIQDMIEMLDNKVARQQKSSSSSGNAKAQSGLNILQELYQLYNIGGGGKGVVGGTLTNLLNGVTGGAYDQNSAVYNDVMSTTLAPIIKAMGDSGALSDSDRAAAEKSMPKITDAPEVAEQKFQALYRILQRAASTGDE